MSTVKKVIIKNTDLPYITFDTDESGFITDLYYALRYRVVSEDKNRSSHWSPINKIVMPPTGEGDIFPYTTNSNISYHLGGNAGQGDEYLTSIWSFPETLSDFEKIFSGINIWDIWTRWMYDDVWTNWSYTSTVSGTSFSALLPYHEEHGRPEQVAIALQIPTLNKVRDFNNDKLTIFYTEGVI